MGSIRNFAPALVVLVVLLGAAFAIGLMIPNQDGQKEQPAETVDDSINAGLSNKELANRAFSNMSKLSSFQVNISSLSEDRQTNISGTVSLGKRFTFSTAGYTVNGMPVPAEEREVLDATDDRVYESTDGGKSWHQVEDGAFAQAMMLSVLAVPWYDAASRDLTFGDGSPRLEIVDGILTRHVVADVSSLPEGDPTWNVLGAPASEIELWIATDSKPLLSKFLARGGGAAPAGAQVTAGTGSQEDALEVGASRPFTVTWTWSRVNEDLGEVKPPRGMGAAEQEDAGNVIHPQKSLSSDAKADYLGVLDFSDDGSLLAAQVSSKGAVDKIVLWRVPDWKVVGVIPPDQTSTSLEQVSAGSGAGAELVAEASAERDLVYVRRASDNGLVATLDFRSPPGPLLDGFTLDPGSLNSTTDFVFVRTPDGREYKLSPEPVMDWVLHSPEDYAVSPDGKYIAGGYDQECVLWVWALPASDAKVGEAKPTSTPQPQQQPEAGEPQPLAPFKTLDIEGAYGGDVAPQGVPGGGLFSPDGQYLVTNVHQGDVVTSPQYHSALVVWRTSDWQRVLTRTLELGFPRLAFSPDSKTLAVGSDGGTIVLYNTSDWTPFRTFRVAPEQVRVAFVPDGSALASASGNDETIRSWRTSDWSELRMQQIQGLCAYCYFDFSPDGRLFTADLVDRSIVNIWRVEDGSIERTFKLPEGTLGGHPSFSRDGSVIKAPAAVGTPSPITLMSEEWTVYMWKVADGQRVDEDPDKGILEGAGENIYRNGSTEPVYVLRRTAFADLEETGMFGNFSPDGRTVVGTCGEHMLCLWQLPEQPPLPQLQQPTPSPVGQPGQGQPGTVGSQLTATPTEPAQAEAGLLVPISEANISRVRQLNVISKPDWVHTLTFVPGTQTSTLAIGSGRKAELWQGLAGKPEQVGKLPSGDGVDPQVLCFSSDGQTVLTGYHSEDDTQHEVRLWRVSDGALQQSFVGHTDLVRAGALSPDGKTMASGGYDRTLRIWNVADGTALHEISLTEMTGGNRGNPRIETLAFSPDGTVLATGSADGIRLWSTTDYTLLRSMQTKFPIVNNLAFSPDGQTLATAGLAALYLWRVSDGTLLHALEESAEHEAVAFSPDGSLLASGAEWGIQNVGTLSIWRVSDGKLLRQLEGHTGDVISLAFSPDGKLLASGSSSSSLTGSGDNSARIWGVR